MVASCLAKYMYDSHHFIFSRRVDGGRDNTNTMFARVTILCGLSLEVVVVTMDVDCENSS